MLNLRDEAVLSEFYPGMVFAAGTIEGAVSFRAAYERAANKFFILQDGEIASAGSVLLSCDFQIRIEERQDRSISSLPAVYVIGVEPVPDRHFTQDDNSACLISPLEEDEFLTPEFSLLPFMEFLVLPFLYGQAFYSLYGRWPWSEYAHGSTGILEAYGVVAESSRATDCVRRLAQDSRTWRGLRRLLLQRHPVKGHTPCPCGKRIRFERCHPRALAGLQMLKRDIRHLGFVVR